MKKLILTNITFFLTLYCYSQYVDNDTAKYRLAYDYIKSDTPKAMNCIDIAKQIVPLYTFILENLIYKQGIYDTFKSREQLSEYLYLEDLHNDFEPYDSSIISNTYNNCAYIIFFSKLRGDMLLADLVENIRQSYDYKKAVAFNSVLRYCFIYKKNTNDIKYVLKAEITYD